MRIKRFFTGVLVLLAAAACAPENLDITPTAAPTDIPLIEVYVTGAVAEPESMLTLSLGSRVSDAIEAAGGATDDANLTDINLARELRDGEQIHIPTLNEEIMLVTEEPEQTTVTQATLDIILENLPDSIPAGSINWRRTNDEISNQPVVFREETNGSTGRVFYKDAGGSYSELTFGVFKTPEDAQAFFDVMKERLATLEGANPRDGFPEPNLFGGGTYGSDAIFVQDNVFIRISVPRFSSTAGEPLSPYARAIFSILAEMPEASS